MHFSPSASFFARGAFWAKATGAASDATSGAHTKTASASSDATLFFEFDFGILIMAIGPRIRPPRDRPNG